MTSPAELIVDFIRKQPMAIRDGICCGFLLMQSDLSEEAMPTTSDGLCEQACKWVKQGNNSTAKAQWAAAACGVIDLFFEGRQATRDEIGYAAEAKDSDFLRQLAPQMDLKNKQFERAQKEWRELRSTSLSLASLHAWETCNPPQRPF